MEIERIHKLADLLDRIHEVRPLGFDMSSWFDELEPSSDPTIATDEEIEECGTTACVAGWACSLFMLEYGLTPISFEYEDEVEAQAREVLGLTNDQTKKLFLMWGQSKSWGHAPTQHPAITAALAATVLRELARTGEVDWGEAPYPNPL